MSIGQQLDDTLAALLTRVALLEGRVLKLETATQAPAPVPVPAPAPTPAPAPAPTPAPFSGQLKLGAVTYYYPGPKWATLLAKGPMVGATIINPNSGPGTSAIAAYVTQVAAAKVVGAPVFGYVSTSYGARAITAVEADIDAYVNFYHVDGIFFDEFATGSSMLPYYNTATTYARLKGLKVCINPGTNIPEAVMVLADYAMVFESSAASYMGRTASDWEHNAAYAGRLWHVVYGCDAATMPAVVSRAKAQNCGLLWVTDDVLSNPYDTNPAYLDALCTEISKP